MATTKAPAIGIDLGTTYSCVAVYQHGNVEIFYNDQVNRTTPSCVAFTDTQLLFGDDARNQTIRNPTNTVFDVKRLIGRRFYDPAVQADMKHWPFEVVNVINKPKIQVEYKGQKKNFFPEEISAMVLTSMKDIAEAHLGQTVTNAVISVPAYFNDAQRRATRDSCTIAGFNVLCIINETTAAAIAFGINKKSDEERNVLIFDLGGGTLDVSIITMYDGIFDVKSTAGNTHLGGKDLDDRLVNRFVEEFKRKTSKDLTTNKLALRRLRTACERAKCKLSSSLQASIELDSLFEGIDFNTSISRADFEDMNDDLFLSTMFSVESAMRDAQMTKAQIQDVVLVGGSSRIPKVQKLLQGFFDGKEFNNCLNPDEAVACGAAIYAAVLERDKSYELEKLCCLNATPFSFGVNNAKGDMKVVMKRNTGLPMTKSLNFTTSVENQSGVFFEVFEGEHTKTKDNRLLAKFELAGILPAPCGVRQIEIIFDVDSNGILNIKAFEKSTRRENLITITNDRACLSEEELEHLIIEAENLRSDKRSEDEKQKEIMNAKKALESYCVDMKATIEDNKLKVKITDVEKKTILHKCNDTFKWLDAHQLAEKEEYECRHEELKVLYASASDAASGITGGFLGATATGNLRSTIEEDEHESHDRTLYHFLNRFYRVQ